MSAIAESNSLFEIDAELDSLLDEIEEQANRTDAIAQTPTSATR